MELSDSKLVAGAIAGDGRAFDELVSRYRSRIYYLVLSKVGQEETARDLAQETFVQAYMSLSSIREPDKFGSWLASIASNVCNSYFRRLREMPVPDETIQYLSHNSPINSSDNGASAARDILYSLPNGTRTAAVLFFVEEMKMIEIAEFLDIGLSAVKSRIRTARSCIRKEMVDMVRQTAKKNEPGEEFNSSIKHKLELARWYRELGELFEVGVPVRTALARLAEADYSASIKDATAQLAAAVESGSTIAGALETIPALVSLDTIPMMRAGEASGMLAWAVKTLADRIEAEETKQNIELSFWCRILSGMLSAGVPDIEALHHTAEITRSKALSQATRDWADSIEHGQQIRSVVDKYSDVLPPMLRVVIITGIPLLSIKLQWVGSQIAESICRHVAGAKIEVPFSSIIALEKASELWADAAIALLQDDNTEIRAAAAEMLGRFKVMSAANDLLKLLDDPEPGVIRAAIRALVDMGAAPPTDALAARFSAEDPSTRLAAVQGISELGQVHEVSEQLAELLADPDERVAHKAVSVLESAGEIEALGNQAVKLVRSSESTELRRRAAAILDKHLFPVPEQILSTALDDELPEVRYAAARILGHRRDPRAAPVIREAVRARRLSQDYLFLADDLEKG